MELLGGSRFAVFHERGEVWVQNCITGTWDSLAHMLGQQGGGASFYLFFLDTEGISLQNECFLHLRKKLGEEPKSDEQRRIEFNSPFPFTDPPSFDPHPLRHCDRLLQKQKQRKQNLTLSARESKLRK